MTKFNRHMFNAFKKKLKNQFSHNFFTKHDVQSNKMKHNVNIKENTHNSIYINIYNKKIQDVPIIPCFSCERLCFKK
jgi:hypothetical protein